MPAEIVNLNRARKAKAKAEKAERADQNRILQDKWRALPKDLQAWLWVQIGRQSALRLQDDALAAFERGYKLAPELEWSDDALAWAARAALRARQPAVALRSRCQVPTLPRLRGAHQTVAAA